MVRIFAKWRAGFTKHTVSRVDGRRRSRAGDDQGEAVVSAGAMMNARGEAGGEAVRLW
jgi:hypothetical protein